MTKKEEIIRVAFDAIQKSGVSGFSFRDLAKTVGIKSSSVHYYFPSKDDLFLGVLLYYKESLENSLQNIESSNSNLDSSINGLIDVFQDALSQNKFCFCGMLAAEISHIDVETSEMLKVSFGIMHDWLVKIIKNYKPEIGAAESESKSRFLLSAMEGAILIDRVNGDIKGIESLRAQLISFF